MALSVDFIYLTARVTRQWIKERGITHFTQLVWGTTNSPTDGDQIRLNRRVHQLA